MKFNFNLKETKIYQAVKWARCPIFRFTKFFKKLFLVLFIFSFLIFLYGFLIEEFSLRSSQIFLGLSIIFLVSAISSWLLQAFLNFKLKNPKIVEKDNLAEFLSFEAAKAIDQGKVKIDSPELNFLFSRALLNIKEIEIQKDLLPKIISEALKIAQEKGHQRIEIGDLLLGLARHDLVFQKILIENNLKIEDLENLIFWTESLKEKIIESKKFWEYKNLIKMGTLAKEWTAGYTITLDRYSTDITEIIKKAGFPEHIGHRTEIENVERILAKGEINNVLLVGEPGVGKKAIIQGLAKKSALGQSLPEINYKRIVALNIPRLLAQFERKEEVERTLDVIFREVITAGNVILTINDFHNYVGGELERPGIVDITGILASYLQLSQFQLIAITSYSGLHKCIEQRPEILNFFEKVEVSEISQKETLLLLENLAMFGERKYRLFVSYPALREIVKLSTRYIPNIPFPKKAMDLLDEVLVYVHTTKDKIVLPRHVAKIITKKTKIPVGEIEIKEKEILLNLEKLLHKRIIDQEEAVKEVSAALRRARAALTIRKGPIGSFLFLGPTGVGKTETSKALAEIYFGSEARMIRLDMSEFQEIKDIPRLIGSPGEEGLLTTPVKENPFSLILLDEIEKAHPNILNLFLQVLDEGFLTDGLGRKVNFKNTMIIATSNAGYKIILEVLEEKGEWSGVKKKLLDHLFEKAIFRPEFINRFDAVIVFRPLSKENLLDIAELMFQKLKKNLKEKGIEFVITLPLKEKIVELSYSPVFGAREMSRIIQDKVGNILASALLSGKLKRGDRVEVDPKEFKLIFK